MISLPRKTNASLTADLCASISLDSTCDFLFSTDSHGTALVQTAATCDLHYTSIWSPSSLFFKPSPLCSQGDLLKMQYITAFLGFKLACGFPLLL